MKSVSHHGLVIALAVLLLATGPQITSASAPETRLFVDDDVAAGAIGSILDFNIGTGALNGSISTLTTPQGLAVTSDATRAYAVAFTGGEWTIEEIDLVSGALLGTVVSGLAIPSGLEISGDDSTLYVAEYGTGVSRVDIASGTLDRIDPNPIGSLFGARGISVNGAEDTAYLALGDKVSKIDLVTRVVTDLATGLTDAQDLEVNPYDTALYITTDTDVTRLDLSTGALTLMFGAVVNDPLGISMQANGRFVTVVDGTNVMNLDLQFGVGGPITLASPLVAPWDVEMNQPADPVLSVPFDASGAPAAIVEIPLVLSNVTGRGVFDVIADIEFDPSVLTPIDARVGDLFGNGGCGFVWSSPTPGSMNVQVACGTARVGKGDVAVARFTVDPFAAPGTITTLDVTNSSVSSGNVVHWPLAGALTVAGAGAVAGNIRYFTAGVPVPLTDIDLSQIPGILIETSTSSSSGAYDFQQVPLGANYEIRPRKIDDHRGAVDIVDALGAAQIAVGLWTNPSPETIMAANVTGDSRSGNPNVSALDAYLIAAFSVGRITEFPIATPTQDWMFVPAPGPVSGTTYQSTIYPVYTPSSTLEGKINLAPLNTAVTAQDFVAVLIGDVDGDWAFARSSTQSAASAPAVGGTPDFDAGPSTKMNGGLATLSIPAIHADPGASIVIPLEVDDPMGAGGIDLLLQYDPKVIGVTSVTAGPVAESANLTSNLTVPGEIRVSMFDTSQFSGTGELIQLQATVVDDAVGNSTLVIADASLDEDAIGTALVDGDICITGAPPAEVQQIQAQTSTDSGLDRFIWDSGPGAQTWRVYRGASADLNDLTCLASVDEPMVEDTDLPTEGELFVYLVSAVSCNGESTLGQGGPDGRPAAPDCF